MTKEQEALNNFLKEYLFLCEKLNTNMQEKMLLDSNSPYNILKNAFEKAPEPFQTGIDLGVIKPKKYLKWEDLEFGGHTSIEVKMGDTQYHLWVDTHLGVNSVTLTDDNIVSYLHLYEKNKKIFNDLRLERVEE